MLCLEGFRADGYGIWSGEATVIPDYLDPASLHQPFERGRDAGYHRLFAVDQRRPVEARLADGDVMGFGALDLVERVGGGGQPLFRHAAAVGAGPAEQIRFDHGDRQSRFPRRHGHTHSGVAAAEDYNVEAACRHFWCPPYG